jgi:GT2 family glycosyltransferase
MQTQRLTTLFLTCHYNGVHHLRDFINSLDRTVTPGAESGIIIVDQGSTDGSREYLRTLVDDPSFCHPLLVAFSDENLGFGGGMNKAYELSLNYDSDFLLFTNNDVVFTQHGWLTEMLQTIQVSSQRAVVSPIANPGGAKTRQERGNSWVETRETDYQIGTLGGYCFLMRTSVASDRYLRCGHIFDPIFGLGYYEDSDLFEWVQERDLELWVSRRAFVHHKTSRTANEVLKAERQTLLTKNKEIYLERWKSLPSALRLGSKRR